MLPFTLQAPGEMAQSVAERVKALRLMRGWTQDEMAARAGIAPATYRVFERTGRISLERLLKVAVILNAQDGFEQLFAPPPARTLAEIAARADGPVRKRGRRQRAKS